MKKATIIYRSGQHQWIAVARDPERPHYLIDTNEYLITDGTQSILTDPGGSEIFPMVFAAVCELSDPMNISALFASHQDPDTISSLSLWLDFNPELKCYISRLWATFIPHFGGTGETFVGIPDEGLAVTVGKLKLQMVPAHYLHSSGNFHLYDEAARLFFSGDIGAALLPQDMDGLFVKDFDRHIRFAEGFHRRWMGSPEAKRLWCERVAAMNIDMLCPQHGAIYQGADIERFINWFSELQVGSGLI